MDSIEGRLQYEIVGWIIIRRTEEEGARERIDNVGHIR